MRPILITAGLVCAGVVSAAVAGGGADVAAGPDLSARVEALTKELESLKPLPKEIKELKEEIRELKLQISVLRAAPVISPAPSNIPRDAIPHEINGTTFYMIPLSSRTSARTESALGPGRP